MATLQFPLFDANPSLSGVTSPIDSLPTIVPTIYDSSAPKPQQECSGYKAWSYQETSHGFTADLRLVGEPCNVFGNDIHDLILQVSYQTKGRLNVRIQPRYISPLNASWFVLDDQFVSIPGQDSSTTKTNSDLVFNWINEPSFQFSISRKHEKEDIFSTFGHHIIYEDQYIELISNMVDDYNIYGLPETVRPFRFPNENFTSTLFNADNVNKIDSNLYGSHPFYQETRYHPTRAHGVYIRNVHAQEYLLNPKSLTFRSLGGSLDLYFFSGPTALDVIRQYHTAIGLPAMPPFWGLGFHQCHWGWSRVQDLKDVVDKYREAAVPLEAIWTDLDTYYKYRPFTLDEEKFPEEQIKAFLEELHQNEQKYVTFVDANIYYPASNESYSPFERGNEKDVFIKRGDGKDYYVGNAWPGSSVWADWYHPDAKSWFANEMRTLQEKLPYDGIWIDVNEATNFCNGFCAEQQKLQKRDDTRNLDHPPYKINSARPTHQIIDGIIPLSALHNNSVPEYDVHNLFSLGISEAAYSALSATGKRPFIISRSTSIGNGRYAGHWGGDNESKFGAMHLGISQALSFQMVGIPMFGTDTCGFGGRDGATEELCARWFELNAFMPFYRNHFGVFRPDQEAYAWPSVAEASRRAMRVRYTLLNYMYTLLYFAHTRGDPVLRALAWEFPDDESLKATDNQFMLGSAILVTPVLVDEAREVKGVFPGIGEGERWYDWYTLREVMDVQPGENVTMAAPLEHINVHVRGGSVLVLQQPGLTTAETRKGDYAILVALNTANEAKGSLYLDDGESLVQEQTKMVDLEWKNNRLSVTMTGNFNTSPPLANMTVMGLLHRPERVSLELGGERFDDLVTEWSNSTLLVTGLSEVLSRGAWTNEFSLSVQ